MLEYAAGRRAIGSRQSNPSALLVIISAHVALLAIVMSAKMERTRLRPEPPITVTTIPDTLIDSKPLPQPHPQPQPTQLTAPRPDVHAPPVPTTPVFTPALPDPGAALGGNGVSIIPAIPQPVATAPVHHDARLLTPPTDLKPPYPADKLLSEEEAVLTLRLTIDEHGRVTDVQPVGRADRSFLESARRHLIAYWRYAPATDDGRAIASTTVITLRFQLDS